MVRFVSRSAVLSALLLLPFCASAQNRLGNPPNVVDGLIQVEGASQLLAGAQAEGVQATADGSGVQLAPGAQTGSLRLGPRKTDFAFNEALPSWNGSAPKNGGFRVWLRAFSGGQGKSETPWIPAGSWGEVPEDGSTSRVVQFPGGKYDIDTLLLQQTADQVDVRIDFFRSGTDGASPVFRLFSLSYTNSTGDRRLARRFGDKRNGQPGGAPRQIEVASPVGVEAPYHSQVVPNKAWIGRICSACAVSSVLGAYGQKFKTEEIAAELLDPKLNVFGVWHRGVQGAAQHGVRGYVGRMRNWEDVRDVLAKGGLVVASVRFEAGEVDDPMARVGKRNNGTKGHLILVKGLAPGGKAIVHDSASKDYGPDSVWSQEELAKAWFDKGGVAYIFTGRR